MNNKVLIYKGLVSAYIPMSSVAAAAVVGLITQFPAHALAFSLVALFFNATNAGASGASSFLSRVFSDSQDVASRNGNGTPPTAPPKP